jgi:hypothetical protein
MLGEFIFPEQSKTKANDFVTRVANKKQRLHSSRRLSWSSRMGWQVVSTTIFKWLLNLWLKMWMNYRVVTADNLLEGRANRVSKRLASLALGSEPVEWRDGNSRPGVPLEDYFKLLHLKSQSYKQLKNWKTNQVNPCAHVVENLVSKRDLKFSSLKIWFSSTVPRISDFQEIRENLLQRLSDFFNGFLISSTVVKIFISWIFWFSAPSFVILT